MPSGYTDSISNEMRNEYAGSKIKLTYAEEYVKVEQINKSNNLILNKYIHKQLGEIYVEQHTVGTVTTTYTLRYHKHKLVLIVCKSIEQPKPSDYPKSPFDFSYKPERSGLIICYLSKENE